MNYTRTDLINLIIKKQGYSTYLEIGYGSGQNFNSVDCEYKIVVDPDPNSKAIFSMTSDEFFEQYKRKFDIIFVDGLHHADQVKKDSINSWECLNDGGCLVIHDTNPSSEDRTHVPCDSSIWNGDVYKFIYQIDSPAKFTLEDDHGVTVVRKISPLIFNDGIIEWGGFEMFREAILHLVTWEEANKIIDGWKPVKNMI